MPLKSMTGFARSAGNRAGSSWQWEVRSVNGKSLDMRLRLPPGFDALEGPAREMCAKSLGRGNVSATLTLSRQDTGAAVRLNEAALAQVAAAARRANELHPGPPASLDAILAQRGVLELVEAAENEDEQAARNAAILDSLGTALKALVADRRREGERLASVLTAQIAEIETLARAIEQSPHRRPDQIAARLKSQLDMVLSAAGASLDPQRLHQEAAILAVKADVEEEVQRLKSHIVEARALIAATEPVGRKLDFLTQEFAREANTVCSKAGDIEITRAGLALKAVIDQLREQAQNIE